MTVTAAPRPLQWRRLLLAVGLCVASGALFLPTPPVEVPEPASPTLPRPSVPIDVGGPIDEPAAAAKPLPPPVAETSTPQLAWQTIALADGRVFVGTCSDTHESITVQAAIRGGTLIRMPPIVIRVPEQGITSLTPYDGALGPINGPFVTSVDPGRQADIAKQRENASIQAEQRRQQAAESERIRQRVVLRSQASKRLGLAEAALGEANRRMQEIAANVGLLDDDRRLKQELANSLQLQLNNAQDRWNQEVQALGPRQRKSDGTWGGGPTEATETLVNALQEQIRVARNGAAATTQRKTAEAAELRQLQGRIPQLSEEIAAARKTLADLDEAPALRPTAP